MFLLFIFKKNITRFSIDFIVETLYSMIDLMKKEKVDDIVKDNIEKIEKWFDASINADMSYEELDEVNESFECDDVDYTIGTIVGEDYQTKEQYAHISLSIWSVPYRENVASNH